MSSITLPDGRLLDVRVSGPTDGVPLVFHHGTPGSCIPLTPIERSVHQHGLRLVSASRPGYGASTRQAGRRVVDVVADTRAVLAAVDAESCYVAGHSGGGPHALACAARLPGVLGTLVIAGAGPADAPDLDFLDGMGEENIVEFGAAAEGEDRLRPYLASQLDQLAGTTPQSVVEALGTVLPDVDRDVLTTDLGESLVAGMVEGLRSGVDGWLDDDLAFLAPWGFALGEVRTPVTLWQGEVDLMVPFAHGQWLAANLPGVQANLLSGEGHLSVVVGAVDRMLDALLAL